MKALEERKAEFDTIYRRAVTHAQAGRETEADFEFARAAAFAPELWCDVATKLATKGEDDAALNHFQIALQVTNHAGIRSGIYNNIGNIYAKRGQLDEAIAMNDLALEQDSRNADAYCNRGQIMKWLDRMPESDRYADRALSINPWHNEAQFLKALNRLDQGDYAKGFPLYESRWRSRTNGIRKVECFQPEWPGPGAIDFRTGQPFQRLFVYCEQGAGDVFLMLRYAPLIRAAGLWQFWALKPGMKKLVGNLVDEASENGDAPEQFDCHIPSASLPRLFGTTLETIPPAPYIPWPTADYTTEPSSRHIGIVWRGNRQQFNDNIRSTSLADWKPVFDVGRERGFKFYSLQVDGAEEALVYPQLRHEEMPADWSFTARKLLAMDLLISVDTGIVHLAGALGLPAWCALHCRPYFVYPKTMDHSPWYPSVKLFKQSKAFEWQPVFERIAAELTQRSATAAPKTRKHYDGNQH